MPASIQNLYTQSRSLQAYTQALQVTGRNIASSADPNYSRQQVNLQSALPGSASSLLGTSVNASIKDTRDQLVEAQIWREQSDLEFEKEQLSYLEQLELSLFSGTDAPIDVGADGGDYLSDSLLTYVSDFLNAWGDLEASPNDSSAKSVVYHSAQALIDRLHSDASNLDALRSTVSDAVDASVNEVNSLLGQVASLQEQISRLPNETSSARLELMSSRDEKLSELSKYMAFTWSPNQASPLESTLSVRLADGSTATLLTGSQVDDTLSWDGTTVSLTNGGTALAADRGQIGAQVQTLDQTITDLENHWNLIAGEMVRIVNAAYNAPGNPGEDFFVAGATSAATISLEVADSSAVRAGTLANGNDIAATIASLSSADLAADYGSPIAGSFADDLLEQQNRLAHEINRERDTVSAQEKVVQFLEQERANRSGVDLDEEITLLLQFQRSFQASSRVLRTLDEVLQSFLSDIS